MLVTCDLSSRFVFSGTPPKLTFLFANLLVSECALLVASPLKEWASELGTDRKFALSDRLACKLS